MNRVYDNGYQLIGSVKSIIEYTKECIDSGSSDDLETIKEIQAELEDYPEDTIVYIDYDCPMGYRIEYFTNNHIAYTCEPNMYEYEEIVRTCESTTDVYRTKIYNDLNIGGIYNVSKDKFLKDCEDFEKRYEMYCDDYYDELKVLESEDDEDE